MKNKKVPDWLNSSLWSTPEPPPHSKPTPPLYSSDDVTHRVIKPPPTQAAAPPKHTAERDGRDPLGGGGGGGYNSNYNSNDDDEDAEEEEEEDGMSYSATSTAAASVSSSGVKTPSSEAKEAVFRKAQFTQELSRKVINMRELRKLSSQGIPDGGGIRATVWKLLLGYLPCDRSLWSSELFKKRSQYKQFKEDLLMNPSEITRRLEKSIGLENDELHNEGKGFLSRSEITQDEHPLSCGKTSIWNQFFQESEIIEQIDRDVKRTHPDINFFSGDTSLAKSNQESLRNILIVFAKLNPGIRYVQGMNEILAPLFYVFKTDPKEDNDVSVEADTFFCFVELISGFRDNFCQQLDNSVVGIRYTISKLSDLLKEHDEELWRHLEVTTKVNPQFYAFRWITLLLTQEFNFVDIFLIWDTLLSDPEGPQETLLRICCAMLVIVRRRLLAGDFTSNLKLLQSYPSTNISQLLYVANKLNIQSAGKLPI